MEGNCVCCASRPATIRKWALSSLWKQQQPCGLSIFMPERGWKLFFKVTFSLSGKRLNTARAQMIGTLLSLKWHRAQQQHSMTLYLIFFFSKHLQQNVSRLTHIDLFCGFRDITLLLSAPDCCAFRNCQSIQWRKMPKRCQSLFNLNGRAYTKNWLGYYWYRRHGRIRDYTSSKKLYLE